MDGSTINSTQAELLCISGSTYVHHSTNNTDPLRVLCTDPAIRVRQTKIGPIVGGTLGGLAIFLAAGILWYLLKKRTEKSSLPDTPERDTAPEPSWVVDDGAPWHGMEVTRFSPFILPPNSESEHDRPSVEANELGRPVSIAPQVHDFTTLTAPSFTSLRRNETDQLDMDSKRLVGQPSDSEDVIWQDHILTLPAAPYASRSMSNMSTLTPTTDADVRTELSLLKAQIERMESMVLAVVQPTSPPAQGVGDEGAPPEYPRY